VDIIENVKSDETKSNFYHIARIFKVYMFQRMTDMYGDIPYFDAGRGYTDGVTKPVYDTQESIYDDMLNELKDAAEKLDENAANTLGKADLIYGGDVKSWRMFAYSEMVRLAMRLSKVDPAKAEQWVKVAVQGGVFTGNNFNAIIKHEPATPNTAGAQVANGTGAVLRLIDPNAYRVSKTFIDYLVNNNDPRLAYIATAVADPRVTTDLGNSDPAIQIGQPNGYDRRGGTTDISKAPNWPGNVNKYSVVNRTTFSRNDAPSFLLTYAETQLLLAEAAFRGWVSDASAETHYRNGVVGAMTQLTQTGASPGISETVANAYVDAHPFDNTNALEQINTQYWVATFSDEIETWSNWRRSGFPILTPVVYFGNATNGTIPRRFTYPTNEPAVNQENYSIATARLSNGDTMTSRVWWDKQ
jgi:hypothetical protein